MRSVILSAVLFALLLASWLGRQPAIAVDPAAVNPRLTSLEIDIWPEFDRPSTLVILRAEIAEGATLPVEVSLRIPTSSGGPQALASSPSADARLIDLRYERSNVQVDFTTVKFTTPDRFFQLEFYDRLRTDNADRRYTYVWPGDLAVGHLIVQVQKPAGSTNLSVQPKLGDRPVAAGGLTYREGDLGAFDVGKPETIGIQYRKTDSRTSAEILGLPTATPPSTGKGSDGGLPSWLPIAAVAASIVVGGGAVTLWLRRGRPIPGTSGQMTRAQRRRQDVRINAGSCQQCGGRLRSRDRFCPECGAPAGRD